MNSTPRIFAAFAAVCFTAVAAFAADVSATGTWKYTQPGRGGAAGIERTLVLEEKGGALTGTLKGATMGQFEIPDTAISEGSFKDGNVKFTVALEFNGNRFVVSYQAKLDGDTLKGTVESPGRDGATQKRDWTATRSK